MLENVTSLEDLTGPNGVMKEMLKSTIERILKAEQEAHLGYPPHSEGGKNTGNSRSCLGILIFSFTYRWNRVIIFNNFW